jgi:hypothetical protein
VEQPEVTWPEVTSPEGTSITCPVRSMFCACSTGSCAISTIVDVVESTPWTLPKGSSDLRSLRVLWNFRLRMRTPKGTPVVMLLLLRKKRGKKSMVTGTKHPRPIFNMVTGTSPGCLPILFSYNVYIGCVVLLRVHLKISTYKHALFLQCCDVMFTVTSSMNAVLHKVYK